MEGSRNKWQARKEGRKLWFCWPRWACACVGDLPGLTRRGDSQFRRRVAMHFSYDTTGGGSVLRKAMETSREGTDHQPVSRNQFFLKKVAKEKKIYQPRGKKEGPGKEKNVPSKQTLKRSCNVCCYDSKATTFLLSHTVAHSCVATSALSRQAELLPWRRISPGRRLLGEIGSEI